MRGKPAMNTSHVSGHSKPSLERVSFKNKAAQSSNEKHPEFFLYVVPGMVQKWRNDKSIPLVDVVDGFQIFVTQTGGNTGVHIHPDRATLDNEFGFHDDTRVVEHILTHGELKGPHVSDALAKDNRTLSRA